MKISCDNCAWFLPQSDQKTVSRWPHARFSDGECRARPAQLVQVHANPYEYQTEWPRVLKDDFCGSWQPLEGLKWRQQDAGTSEEYREEVGR